LCALVGTNKGLQYYQHAPCIYGEKKIYFAFVGQKYKNGFEILLTCFKITVYIP